jgi:hypothetical protein
MIELVFLLIPLLPVAAVILGIRHGPVPNRWWRGERALGFAAFVATVAFTAGFVGPMLLAPGANQGPMLGIFITGPIGALVGLVWGLARARGR